MAVHVPFSQRPSGMRHQGPPVYIGFDEPVRARRKFNWWGFNALFLFFISLGTLSPITLLISLIGLRRRPRKMAIAGTLFSMIGIGVMVAGILAVVNKANHRHMARERAYQNRVVQKQVEETRMLLATASEDFDDFRSENDGSLPDAIDGNVLVIKHIDPWKKELRYESTEEGGLIRSAGPDGSFDTRDDVVLNIDGQSDTEPLLPID